MTQDETKFEANNFQSECEMMENSGEGRVAFTQVTGMFDFAGFADFDSFNDATQPFNNESAATSADFQTSDFAERKDDFQT
jgi:hypothetical protein